MIPISSELRRFEVVLDKNDRCIFSARFGDGKSCFLSDFMRKYNESYLFIPIYPVNYQVAENKDVFEYIKRDILIRLITSEGIDVNDEDIKKSWILFSYLGNNPLDVVQELIRFLPSIKLLGLDFSLHKVLEAINNLKDKFEKYKESFDAEADAIEAYLKKYDVQQGSIYEFDPISQLICDLNDRYREKYPHKKIVLIIEDLDRIDPAHIFRILNIFSAHFDRPNCGLEELEKTIGLNKFKFDKIVTVCHYENIKNIYAHFYGDKTDFNGYIDKFSSTLPFHYSLKHELMNYILKNICPDLQKYYTVSEAIAELIIRKYENTSEGLFGNLRIIKSRLKSGILIEHEEISINKDFKILSDNDFTKLLDLLHKFNIQLEELRGRLIDIDKNDKSKSNNATKELDNLIGACWLISGQYDPKMIIFTRDFRLVINYDEYEYIPIELNVEMKNGIVISIDLSYIYRDPIFTRMKNQERHLLVFFQKFLLLK